MLIILQQLLKVEVYPLLRLRPASASPIDIPRTAMAATFIDSTSELPNNLLPPPTSPGPSLGSFPSSLSSRSGSEPASPRRGQANNFQHVLVFDPVSGVLALRRIKVELRPKSENVLPAASVSLPSGLGTTIGRMSTGISTSPPIGRISTSPSQRSGLTRMMDGDSRDLGSERGVTELAGYESVVARWDLRRGRDWLEVKRSLVGKLGDTGAPSKLLRKAAYVFAIFSRAVF